MIGLVRVLVNLCQKQIKIIFFFFIIFTGVTYTQFNACSVIYIKLSEKVRFLFLVKKGL